MTYVHWCKIVKQQRKKIDEITIQGIMTTVNGKNKKYSLLKHARNNNTGFFKD